MHRRLLVYRLIPFLLSMIFHVSALTEAWFFLLAWSEEQSVALAAAQDKPDTIGLFSRSNFHVFNGCAALRFQRV